MNQFTHNGDLNSCLIQRRYTTKAVEELLTVIGLTNNHADRCTVVFNESVREKTSLGSDQVLHKPGGTVTAEG